MFLTVKNQIMLSALQNEIKSLKINYNKLYDESKNAIANHSSYRVRQQYYPYNLEKWETIEKDIKTYYNTRLTIIKNTMKKLEKKIKQTEKDYEQAKIEDKDRMTAAKALLMLNKKRTAKKETYPPPLRRSARVYIKSNNDLPTRYKNRQGSFYKKE